MESLNGMRGRRESNHGSRQMSRVVPATRLRERVRMSRLNNACASIAHHAGTDCRRARTLGISSRFAPPAFLAHIRYHGGQHTGENEVQTR